MFDASTSPEAQFLMKHFASYYGKHFIDSIPSPENREFGFGVFKRKIANRNLSFSSANEVNSFLRSNAPLFFSYSNSYYKFPSRTPTPSKIWQRADVIYEFDADELGLEVPEINGVQWFAPEHLTEAKRQVFRLLEFIENDFNFSTQGIAINFSGKAGFHVHIRSQEIQNLKRRARIELVDYLTAQSVDFVNLGFDFAALTCPIHRGLWGKRLIKGAKEVLSQSPKEVSKITTVQQKKVSQFLESKEAIFEALERGRLLPIGSKKTPEFWQKIFEFVLARERVPIDRQTSVDLNKIIRVPETLHGDTGLLAKMIPLDSLEKFDPFRDAVVFGSEMVKLRITKTPKFSLTGESFGPFEEVDTELPLFAAIFLIGKGAAVLRK